MPHELHSILEFLDFISKCNSRGFAGLLYDVAEHLDRATVHKSITDWPFANFWTNPKEPRHSKLIGYFIDPSQPHGYGSFLLRKFLDAIGDMGEGNPSLKLPSDGCRVLVESDRVDILIIKNDGSYKYAAIIENKVNGASDQKAQLQGYFARVKTEYGLDDSQIHVFYLPLTTDKSPSSDSLGDIKSYRRITYKDHILKWLDEVLNANDNPDWPITKYDSMHQNLLHYRNLIQYLINKESQVAMDNEIIAQWGDATNLPEWSDVESLKNSSVALQRCLERRLRGEVLVSIQEKLNKQDIPNVFKSETGVEDKRPNIKPSDEIFATGQSVHIASEGIVPLSFGADPLHNPTPFWIGIGRSNLTSVQVDRILKVANDHLQNFQINDHQHAWAFYREMSYDNCSAKIDEAVKKLLAMHGELSTVLPTFP